MMKRTIFIKNNWIDWLQVAVLLILSPFFLFPSMDRTWIFIVIPLFWLGRGITKKQLFERTILDWAILLLLIQVAITCFIVPNLAFSLSKIAGVTYGVAVFYSLVALLKSENLLKGGVALFLGGGLAFSIIGLLGMSPFKAKYLDPLISIKSKIPYVNIRLPGAEDGFHPNAVGGTLILIIPLFFTSIYPYLRHRKNDPIIKNRFFPIFACFGLIVVTCILLLTQSRGSLLGVALSSWIFLLQFFNKRTGIISTFLFVAAVFFIIGTFYIMPVGKEKIADSTIELSSKILGRTSVWTVGIETIRRYPLTGIGMNQIRLNPEIGYKTAHVHNHFLHTAAELGIPGLISLLVILIGAGIMCIKIWRKTNQYWIKMTILGLAWGQVAHLIFGLADAIPLGAKTGIFFWLSLALIAAIFNFIHSPNYSDY